MPCEILPTGDATAILPVTSTSLKPITVIGTPAIRNTFDEACLQQAVNSRMAPGVTELVLNPDAHCGYGAPVGCVLVSPTHVYPGPVGVDIKCSMSLLQLSIPADAIEDRRVRRALIQAICERTPTGAGRGQQSAAKSRRVGESLGRQLMLEGASASVCEQLGIPPHWAERCEDAFHLGHDDTQDALGARLDHHMQDGFFRNRFPGKMKQLGSYGGGNHFGECETVQVGDSDRTGSAGTHHFSTFQRRERRGSAAAGVGRDTPLLNRRERRGHTTSQHRQSASTRPYYTSVQSSSLPGSENGAAMLREGDTPLFPRTLRTTAPNLPRDPPTPDQTGQGTSVTDPRR